MSGSSFDISQERLWSQIVIKNDICDLTMHFTSKILIIKREKYIKLNTHTIKSRE